MLTSQLAGMLARRVLWTGTSGAHQEYVVGTYRKLRIRLLVGDKMADVAGEPLTVAQIQASTD